ncbi:hypothetical protein LMH73_003695 [Vibrio splendidus]|nr:hypothetical protein [Vibrio splendidus]MCC4882969.1 hypothetical protein [Vibrio splendidus]
MQFAKRKVARAILVALLLLPGTSSAGVPVVDFPSIPPAVMENLRKAKETYDMISIYTNLVDNKINGYLIKLETTIGINIFDTKTKLELEEDLHNLRIQELNQPLPDICRKVTAKPSVSTRKHNVEYVSKAADQYAASSSAAYTASKVSSTKVEEISEEEVDQKATALNKATDYSDSIIGNMKALRPDLTDPSLTESQRAKLAEKHVESPMSTQGDYAMNPNAFLVFTPHQQIAMQDMVRLIVPPLISYSDGNENETEVVEELSEQAKRGAISAILSGNIAKRVPNEDGVSELSLVNQYDIEVYKGASGAGVENTLSTRLNTEVLTMTASPITREQALMMASSIHFSLEEYKANMNKEYMFAMKLIEQLEDA